MVTWKRTNIGGVRALLVVLALAVSVSATAAAAQDSTARPDYAQSSVPLAEALRRFAHVSGYDVVFQEELVAGRRSAPVKNARNAHDALMQMLAGSGLAPRFTRPDAFILEPLNAATPPDLALDRIEVISSILGSEEQAYRWYGEKLLEVSLATLRRSRKLGMRSYDFTIYVWLSADGRIEDLEGFGGTEQGDVLGVAKEMLKGLIVGIVPPANMPQPVGLRITAQ